MPLDYETTKIIIEIATIIATIAGAYATMRGELKTTRAEMSLVREAVAEVMKVGVAAHKRIDEHERRLSAAERDILNQGRNLDLSLARLEDRVAGLSTRFDTLLLRLTVKNDLS